MRHCQPISLLHELTSRLSYGKVNVLLNESVFCAVIVLLERLNSVLTYPPICGYQSGAIFSGCSSLINKKIFTVLHLCLRVHIHVSVCCRSPDGALLFASDVWSECRTETSSILMVIVCSSGKKPNGKICTKSIHSNIIILHHLWKTLMKYKSSNY